MRILLVHNHYRQRSGEDVVFSLEAKLLSSRGHDVRTFCRGNEEIQLAGVGSKLKLLRDTIWSSRSYRALFSTLRETKPDIAHVHNTFPLISPSVYFACGDAGVPVVQTLHNFRMFCAAATLSRGGSICETCLHKGRWHGVLHACYRDSRTATAASVMTHAMHGYLDTWNSKIARYIALTNFARSKFTEAGVPDSKLRVKPNFVDPPPGPGCGSRSYALFVGRLFPEKGGQFLLQAWSQLELRIPLLIVGSGPSEERMRSQSPAKHRDSIRFLGQLPRESVMALMQQARFLVVASSWYENFPMVIVESFANGVPVICPRLGAMEDVVAHGRTGLYYTPGDSSELAQTLSWAWTHPSEMRAMGIEARNEYETKYTAEKNYPILMDIYDQAIREGPAGHFSADTHPTLDSPGLPILP